jgi:hypothetical protein
VIDKDSTDAVCRRGCIGPIEPFLKVTDIFKKCITDICLTRLIGYRLSSLDEELEHDICRPEKKIVFSLHTLCLSPEQLPNASFAAGMPT